MKRNTVGVAPEYKDEAIQMGASDNWRTPQPLFDKINDEFHFVYDLAADDNNHKLPLYYTLKDNALTKSWDKTSFANYPYSSPAKWFFKAWEESIHHQVIIVLFAKVATSENYWVQTVKYAQTRFLAGRTKFWDENNTIHYGASFASALVIFDPSKYNRPTTEYWNYNLDKPEKLF